MRIKVKEIGTNVITNLRYEHPPFSIHTSIIVPRQDPQQCPRQGRTKTTGLGQKKFHKDGSRTWVLLITFDWDTLYTYWQPETRRIIHKVVRFIFLIKTTADMC